MEMVTIYTQEGSDLTMVHYCILGNQHDPAPALRKSSSVRGRRQSQSGQGHYMGQTTLTLIDDDHISVECISARTASLAKAATR